MDASTKTDKEQTQDNSSGALVWRQANTATEVDAPAMLPFELVIFPQAPAASNKKD